MAEILGLGVSHYPPLSGLDEDMANAHRGRLNDPDIPDTANDPNTWSELAQREWADPVAAAASHRAAMRTGMSRVRQALDDFAPDFVLTTARILRDSGWRVAVLASSSWSHAFLCDKTYRLAPDVASDRLLYFFQGRGGVFSCPANKQ